MVKSTHSCGTIRPQGDRRLGIDSACSARRAERRLGQPVPVSMLPRLPIISAPRLEPEPVAQHYFVAAGGEISRRP